MARAANPQLKQQLVAAATEIFAAHGLATARVSDITALAGTSKGAFYLHFASKEAAYVAIARDFLDQLLALLRLQDEAVCEAVAAGALESVADADRQFMEFLWEHRRPLAMVLDGAAGTSCAFMQDEFIDSILHHMRESVAAHHRAHPQLAKVIDAEFATTMAAGIVFMYARRMIREHRPPFAVEQLMAFRALIASGQANDAVWRNVCGEALPVPPTPVNPAAALPARPAPPTPAASSSGVSR